MAVETEEDRAAFVADFGVEITWTRDGVAQAPFLAIFNRPTRRVEGLSAVDILDRDAFLHGPEVSLPAGAAEDDPVAVAGESQAYACRSIRPDGTGWCVVDLKRA